MELMNVKKYEAMTAEEQERWVSEFAEWAPKGRELAKMTAGWTKQHTTDMEQGLVLLAAWPFAQDFCEKAHRYGDYDRRAYRLPVYIDKVTEKLADGLTMTDEQGKVVAFVSPSAPMRRRGRPTKEEVAARLRGDAVAVQGGDDAEARKRRVIARMLGLEVVVSGDAPREKNNAELKAEREARRAMEEKMNPSLFGGETAEHTGGGTAAMEHQPSAINPQPSAINPQTSGVSPCAQLMNDSYEARMAQDKLHLDQLAWLMSKPLQERVKMVQSQRTAAEAASERAKMLAEMGGKQEEIAEYAEQAKVATEAYLATYAAVDEELAVLHKRLYLDLPFLEQFKARYRGVDIEKIQYITRPYYEKVKKESPEIDVRIRTIIEQENPEYAAKMKAEQEKKEELQQLHRYIMRTDKPASDERVKTMTERIERVRQLAGDEVAKSYLPVLEKTKEENAALNKAKSRPTPDPSLSGRGVDSDAADKKPAVKTTGTKTKTADKKSAKPSTKQEKRKSTKQESKAASKREQGDE